MKASTAHKVESNNDSIDAFEIDQILDRRVIVAATTNKAPTNVGVSNIITHPKSAGSDYKDFYDDYGTKTTGMYLDGHTEYLVKWRRGGGAIVRGQGGNDGDSDVADVNYDDDVVGCRPTTWITKEELEDRGFMMDIKAYHAGKDTSRNNTQRGGVNANETVAPPEVVVVVPPPVKPTTTKLSHPKPTKQQQQKQHHSSLVEMQETFFAETSPIEKICGFSIETESNRFAMKRMTFSSYGSCISEKQHSTFLQCVHRYRKTHTPTVLYYGVPASKIPEICRSGGFKMPESISDRPRHQQHGYSHGVGLYAFPDPFMCASYCTPITTAPPPPTTTTTTIHQKQPKKPKGGTTSSKPVPRRVLMCIGLVPTDDDAGAAYDENVTVVPDYCVIFNNRDLIVPVWVVDFFRRREGCITHRSVFNSYESLEYINGDVMTMMARMLR